MDKRTLGVYSVFSRDIDDLFEGRLKAMYAFGSAVYDDLHIGYSDLDFFAVVSCDVTEEHFGALLEYRKKLKGSDDPLFGLLEGEFVPESLLVPREGGNVGYWGTSGERIKTRYDLAGFSMKSLLGDGVLIYGSEVRETIPYTSDTEMLIEVKRLIDTVRKYAVVTNEGIHSADWLFLICQSLYWLRTGETTCKTKAAEWARNNLSGIWVRELDQAIAIRLNPDLATQDIRRLWLSNLGGTIQAACGDLESEYLCRIQ